MMGLSVVRVCKELGVRRAGVSTVYYDADWTESYAAFLASAGMEVIYAGSFAEQGVAPAITLVESCHHKFSEDVLMSSVRRICELAPDAEVIVIAGIPCAQLELLADLEQVAGRPVVNYLALHARILKRLGIGAVSGKGRLSETLIPVI